MELELGETSPRRHSLANGEPDCGSETPNATRMRLPRSKSTSNMLDITNSVSRAAEDQLRDAVREQVDKDDLRALAEFFRTTEPPPSDPVALRTECFGFPSPKVHKRFSAATLRRGKKAKWSEQRTPAQLPKSAIPDTTAAGHRHIAITIPAAYDSTSPWSRAQYPVTAPGNLARTMTGPTVWPERTSSRGSVASSGQERGATSHSGRGSPASSSTMSFGEGVKHSRSMTSLSAVRPSTSRPSLNPVDECHEYFQDPQHAEEGIVTPLTAPSKPLQRSLSMGFGQNTLAFRHPTMGFKFPKANSTAEINESGASTLRHRRQMSKRSKESKDLSAQSSPRGSPELVLKPGLTVPKASTLPESPGFPDVLASMTFPSPPSTSRPSSRANSISSASLNHTSLVSPFTPPLPSSTPKTPFIQPRTTSKRACVTTPFSPTASLNEIMMRRTSPACRSESSDRPETASSSVYSSATASIGPDTSETKGTTEPQVELYQDELTENNASSETPEDDTTPTGNTKRDSLASSYIGEGRELQRHSTASNITGSTDTHSHLTTNSASFRLSARSDLTTSTCITSKDGVWGHEIPPPPAPPAPPHRGSIASSIGTLPIMGGFEYTDSPTLGKGENGSVETRLRRESNVSSTSRKRESLSSTTPTSATFTASPDDEELEPTKMVERRMARKAKVHEYKQRDLNAIRTGVRPSGARLSASMDSPVLGWFPHEASRMRPPPNRSPLAQAAPWSSSHEASAIYPIEPDYSRAPGLTSAASQPIHHMQNEAITHPVPQSNGWSLSPLMVSAATTPGVEGESSFFPPPKNELVMSSVMETASIDPHSEPQQEPDQELKSARSSHRLSTLLLLEGATSSVPGSRASLRPMRSARPLSKSKPPPITISRNPVTGAIERTIAPPKVRKASISYPHGVAAPTPPKPLDNSNRRWSFPVRVSQASPPTSWEPPPLSPPMESHESEPEDDEDSEKETRSRDDIVRERLQREKEEKEREIDNIVARTVVPTPSPKRYEEVETPEPPVRDEGVGEVERRLKRLEKNGDAWLRVMGPLLENMTKTLDAMRKDGVCGELVMSEFMIDMEAEARRFSLLGQAPPTSMQATSSGRPSGDPDETKRQQPESPSPSIGKEKKKMGRGRSSSSLSRLRMQFDRAAKRSIDLTARHGEHDGPRDKDSAKSGVMGPRPSAARPTTPRSPQEHDFEVEMAIRQRIKKQEAEFNELMNKWNVSRPPSRHHSDPRSPSAAATSFGIDHHLSNDSPPEVPTLRIPTDPPHGEKSPDSAMETPVDPMLRELKCTSWPKKTHSFDTLVPPPAAGDGVRRRSNTVGPGGDTDGGVSPIMRDLRSATLLECKE